eukprot:CAMPEP_0174735854 /NCGR_PEP_ID=MMETSP1094-20130205/65665_1 /TAXON_ID=156173 /ORGANISM="Chrysochromulina brevifilum, Strain UTEX LB 985" /LENGTH=59 /DNA_ID=CAMNT_0015938869 /DNA_START=305 /DNA_END=484 /DNA_ORIENTATION=+
MIRTRATSRGVTIDCAVAAETAPPMAASTADSFAPPLLALASFLMPSYNRNFSASTGVE